MSELSIIFDAYMRRISNLLRGLHVQKNRLEIQKVSEMYDIAL